jgi:hypothetical protein
VNKDIVNKELNISKREREIFQIPENGVKEVNCRYLALPFVLAI